MIIPTAEFRVGTVSLLETQLASPAFEGFRVRDYPVTLIR